MTTIEFETHLRVNYSKRIDPQLPLFRPTIGGLSWDNFPPTDQENEMHVNLFLVSFYVPIGVRSGIARLNEMGLQAPDARDLIEIAKAPNWLMDQALFDTYGVVCLCRGNNTDNPYFPVLRFPKRERRELDLNLLGSYPWSRLYLFLGVKRYRIVG